MKLRIYPTPNPALAQVLLSPRMRTEMSQLAAKARGLYMGKAPKRTGKLASSAKHGTRVSNKFEYPRWTGFVQVGADYSVWNEMGAGPRRPGGKLPRATGKKPFFGSFKGSFTFEKVVDGLKAI
ncbi:head-tail connector protein [Gordonia phage Neville]|uniref:Uncharacterized protein n=2 Tax=Nevillevirus TaxID=3044773 RepID=A0A515MGW1_9CAUD|nr:head-tail connector protein [Gordonia phage Neville]YP_010246004.1 head-tail connector protein [Gordonia phage Trax]AXQ64391.1 hypothetical protein SEA_NEVILLE_19 [Gordonia phage Neville]QDM55906.1 hypothetical protein SEA_TRAX_19 [Gordonia phage Trax]